MIYTVQKGADVLWSLALLAFVAVMGLLVWDGQAVPVALGFLFGTACVAALNLFGG